MNSIKKAYRKSSAGTRQYYKPELDALRFFAFVAVYCDHIDLPFRWWHVVKEMGRFGLPLFFLLSAYLIVVLLLREQQQTGGIDVQSFFVRRVLRIWPLYFLVLFLGFFIGKVYPPAHLPGSAFLSMAFLVGNVWLIRHGWQLLWANPLWSLSVEEQFYLVVPGAMRRYGQRPRVLARGCFALIAISYVVLTVIGLRRGDPSLDIWCNSLAQFQFFAAGALLALWHRGRTVDLQSSRRAVLLVLGIFLWWAASQFGYLLTNRPLPVSRLLTGNAFILVGTILLLIGVLDTSVKIPAAIRYLGKISFGLYVFHNIWLFVFFNTSLRSHLPRLPGLVTLASPLLTLLTAALSYHYYESPFLRLKSRFERIRTRPV